MISFVKISSTLRYPPPLTKGGIKGRIPTKKLQLFCPNPLIGGFHELSFLQLIEDCYLDHWSDETAYYSRTSDKNKCYLIEVNQSYKF